VRRNILSIVRTWAPVAIWKALIFIFSTDAFAAPHTASLFAPLLSWLIPGISPEMIQTLHGMLRKLGHWSEYFILANLLGTTFKAQWPERSRRNRFTGTVIVATLYAISDEWHQSLVPSRSASAIDVAIDGCGAICGAFWTQHRDRTHAAREIAQQLAKKT
jgi:VanZ family protein